MITDGINICLKQRRSNNHCRLSMSTILVFVLCTMQQSKDFSFFSPAAMSFPMKFYLVRIDVHGVNIGHTKLNWCTHEHRKTRFNEVFYFLGFSVFAFSTQQNTQYNHAKVTDCYKYCLFVFFIYSRCTEKQLIYYCYYGRRINEIILSLTYNLII